MTTHFDPHDLMGLLDCISLEAPSFPLAVVKELVAHGEPVVALENLCDNLHELDVRLELPASRRLVASCRAYEVHERYWLDLVQL